MDHAYQTTLMLLPEGHSWIETIELPTELMCTDDIFQSLMDLRPSTRGKIVIFGKEIDVPRWQQSFGEDYWFSGMNHKAEKITSPYLQKLLEFVQKNSGKNYRQILVNWYMDGKEYIGAHSDDESQLVKSSSIYSFSFGAERDLLLSLKRIKNSG